MNTFWNVITAGPSAGKTSTIRDLSARGFRTAPEAARLFIDEKVSKGYDAGSVREEFEFQTAVELRDKQIESKLNPSEVTFLDRSLADNIAYRRFYGKDVREELKWAVKDKYQNVFLLERLHFEDDYARDEDEEEAAALHETIRETYEDLGYDVIDVPLMPVPERGDFIMEHIY